MTTVLITAIRRMPGWLFKLALCLSLCLTLTLTGCGGGGGGGSSAPATPPPDPPPPDPPPVGNQAISLCGTDGIVPANLDSTTPAARYCLTFTAQWRLDTFIRIPGGAHFTTLVIARVNMSSSLWEPGGIASPGLELVAEIGGVSRFLREIAAEAERGMARSGLTVTVTSPRGVGTSTMSIDMTQEYPLITFASMIAPSPDWFVGLHEYPLINDQVSGSWIRERSTCRLMMQVRKTAQYSASTVGIAIRAAPFSG